MHNCVYYTWRGNIESSNKKSNIISSLKKKEKQLTTNKTIKNNDGNNNQHIISSKIKKWIPVVRFVLFHTYMQLMTGDNLFPI